MKVKVKLNGKVYNVTAWTLGKEKEALLSFSNTNNWSFKEQIDVLAEILIPNVDVSNYMDKFYIMVVVSATINMDYKNISYICPHCGSPCHNTIDIIDNLVYTNTYDTYEVDDCVLSLGESLDEIEVIEGDKTAQEVIDSLTIKQIQELKERCENVRSDLILSTESLCVMCGKKTKIVRNKKDLLENYIIGIDISYYYDTLRFFLSELNFTPSDFNNLYPFEIEVLTPKDNK